MNFLKLLKLHFLITWNDKRGAVVTHGGTLPDSSQKADFYGLIDNATVSSIQGTDLSASANIQDSQLNTISTAGKVNVSSLTGQIANANLAQLVNAALVSGAALTLLPNVPSGAGILPAANVGGIVGSAVSKTVAQIYQALTDGYVTCIISCSGNTQINGITDSSASPTTSVTANSGTNGLVIGISFLVKKNNYYECTIPGGAATTSAMYFSPIGS